MKILGISAFYHDAAACLIDKGRIVAAAHEERFSRRKNDASFPLQAIQFCLQHSNINPGELQAVVFYEKPILKLDRILETYLAVAPAGFRSFRASFPLWMRDKLNIKKLLVTSLCEIENDPALWRDLLRFSTHHLSHAASAFYPSPFEDAAVVALDGVGEWATGSIWKGEGSTLKCMKTSQFPHSLGLLYAAFTQYLGFRVNDGEYKVMGLASYGTPRHAETILKNLLTLLDDGSFHLNMNFLDFTKGVTMTNKRFHALFGQPPRKPGSDINKEHQDIAASIQKVTEEALVKIAAHARTITGSRNLCMAGGVALNCSANTVLAQTGLFDSIWVQPAAGDAGGAVGAALGYYHQALPGTRRRVQAGTDLMGASLLGPMYADTSIIRLLEAQDIDYELLDEDSMLTTVVDALQAGSIVGWFQGRAEFGPRALGARSILASPMFPDMQRILNQRIKKRESFRPFAPSILSEESARWFDMTESPYMLFTCRCNNDMLANQIPAVVHADGTSRLQTVAQHDHPLFHRLLSRWHVKTGIPILLNTSFNVKDEPIVNTPEDAIRCARNAGLDLLALGNVIVRPNKLRHDQLAKPFSLV